MNIRKRIIPLQNTFYTLQIMIKNLKEGAITTSTPALASDNVFV